MTYDRSQLVRSSRYDEQRFANAAAMALHRMIADAQDKLEQLERRQLLTTIGGAALNHQDFMDAERNLVRWWDACGVVSAVEDGTEEA